jgi:hypothetical protein
MATTIATTGYWTMEIVRRCDLHRFVVLPKRWIVTVRTMLPVWALSGPRSSSARDVVGGRLTWGGSGQGGEIQSRMIRTPMTASVSKA